MIDIGRVCVKIAGRDAGKKCVVIDILDQTYVLVDGQTRRRKVNMLHVEPLPDVLDLTKGASRQDVMAAFKSRGWSIRETKPKSKPGRPMAVRAKKEPIKTVQKAIKKKLDEKVKAVSKVKIKESQKEEAMIPA